MGLPYDLLAFMAASSDGKQMPDAFSLACMGDLINLECCHL
jgi:hypothetical protein